MKQHTVPLRSAISALGELPTAVEAPEERAARRTRVVAHLKSVNRALPQELKRARTRRLVRVGAAFGAFAACAGLALALAPSAWRSTPRSDHGPKTVDETLHIAVLRGRAWHSAGDAVRTLVSGSSVGAPEPGLLETLPGGWAKVVGSGGLEVEVSPDTRLSLPGATAQQRVRQLDLARGSVRCSVDPGGTGEKLWVVTPDARVVVKGTVFTVTVAESLSSPPRAGGSKTCVRVERGKVAVSQHGSTTEVVAGGSWGCEPLAVPPGAAAEPAPSVAVAAGPKVTPPASSGTRQERVAPGSSGTTLGQETALLAEALAAERQGDLARAEARLVQLRGQYPKSPLIPDATTALARIRERRKR